MSSILRFGLVVGLFGCCACGGAIADADQADQKEEGDRSGEASRAVATPPQAGAADAPGPVEPGTSCGAPTTIETLADLRSDPNQTMGRVLVDARHLYVDTNKGTMRVPRCGGVATKIADNSPGQYMASGLVQNATSIFLAASAPLKGGFVRRISKSGGKTPTELASNARDLFGLAAIPAETAARLYWVERGAASDELREMDVESQSTRTIATLPTAYAHGPFFADAAGVSFFSMSSSNNGTYSTWSPETGRRTVATGPAAVELVGGAIAGDEMYFSFGHTGANGVARLARQESSAPVLVTDGNAPYGLTRHGDTLYFTDISRNTVTKCALTSSTTCEPIIIAPNEEDPRFLAVDDVAVYWTTRRGLLRRAPL